MLRTALALASITCVFAVNFGIVDDESHPFAGVAYTPRAGETCYLGVGGTTLIDAENLFSCPEQVRRRIVLISGWHTNPANDYSTNPVFVSFSAAPQVDISGCSAVSSTSEPLYRGSHLWTSMDLSGQRNGEYERAFGVVLLDESVSDGVVQGPLPVVGSYPPAPYMQPGSDCISKVGIAAYGIKGFGNEDTLLGKPIRVPQPPVRQYVELDVLSVLKAEIKLLGVPALEEGTLCFGDGGSGLFTTQRDSADRYTLLGMVSGFPSICRAVDDNMRLDTEYFYNYIRSIDSQVCQKAGAQGTRRDSEAARTAEGSAQSTPAPLSLIVGLGLGGGVGLLAVVAAVSTWWIRRPVPQVEEFSI